MRLDRSLLAGRGRLARLIALVVESRVRLRLAGSAEPSHAPEQSLEDITWARGRSTAAFGVVARDQIPCAAPGARLQLGEIGLHPRDLAVEIAALWRRLRAEKQELSIPATEGARIGFGPPEFGSLTVDRRLRAARAAPRRDGLLEPRAFRVLRKRNVSPESDDRRRKRGQGQNLAGSERAWHASVRHLHPVNRLRACELSDVRAALT